MEVYRRKILSEATLILVHEKQPLSGNGWRQEERECPRRERSISEHQKANDWRIEGKRQHQQRPQRPKQRDRIAVPAKFEEQSAKGNIRTLRNDHGSDGRHSDIREVTRVATHVVCKEAGKSGSDRTTRRVGQPANIRTGEVTQQRGCRNDHRS